MKKYFVLFVLLFLLVSCSFPSYIFENKAQATGVDFTSGKWLLNNVEAPVDVEDQLAALVLKDFKNFLSNRVTPVNEVKGLLLTKKVDLNPNKNLLEDIRKGTNFDFFINIKALHVKEEFGVIDVTPHRFNTGGTNQSEVVLEIYDLNRAEIIYSQKVIASIEMPKDNQDVHFFKPSSSLVMRAYKKLKKDIDKKSIK